MPAVNLYDASLRMVDPALNGRWFCPLPGTDASTVIMVETATSSFVKVAAKPRFADGSYNIYADFAQSDAVNLVLYEDEGFNALKFIETWRKQVYDVDTGEYGLPSEFKRTLELYFFPINSNEASLKKVYEGVWPTDQQPFELNYTEVDGRLTVPIVLSVDDIKIVPLA